MKCTLRIAVLLLLTLASSCLDNLSGIPYPACGQSDEDLCALNQASCGSVAVVDECGKARTVDCGGCPEPDKCGEDNTCGCESIEDEAYCALVNAECGTVSGTDPCGVPRAVACGKCTDDSSCLGNSCVCEGISDEELCVNFGAQCGALMETDGCGEMRQLECGSCDEQETCTDNLCTCVPESDEDLCARNGLNCGQVPMPLTDNCGDARTVDCGTCNVAGTQGLTCGGGGTDNVCGCEGSPDADLCAAYNGGAGAECGFPQITDSCGNTRLVNCGTCTSPETCGGEMEDFQCGCANESPEQFCARRGFECDTVTGEVDNCGDPIDAVDCGDCDDPDECGVAAANRCACVPESQADFCQSQNASCGMVSGDDQCGDPRTASCGSCPAGERCGITSNKCECAPETQAQFCSRLNACGATTAPNNCGTEITVQCGSCPNGGACSNNTCSNCTPESDQQFCARLGVFCGSASGTDNCGGSRSTNCGGCDAPFDCENNVCVCEADLDEDSVYCSNSLAECGSIYFQDECGVWQTANCGACSDPTESCVNNRCRCVPETAAELCAKNGAECGTISVQDQCGFMRTPHCGECALNIVCLSNQCLVSS